MFTPHQPWRNYTFDRIPSIDLARTKFQRSGSHSTTLNAGLLYPLFCDEVVPGDTFILSESVIARLTTPLVPFFGNLTLDAQFFFVPNRLVWTHWVNMMGERPSPNSSIDYTVPVLGFPSSVISANRKFEVGSIFDYFSLPTDVHYNGDIDSLMCRAYNLIWNEWYRDENLQEPAPFDPDSDGPDLVTDFTLRPRNKRKGRMESALPWPQKGDQVLLPLGSTAPVRGTGNALGLIYKNASTASVLQQGCLSASTNSTSGATSLGMASGASGNVGASGGGNTVYGRVGVNTDGRYSGLEADLSQATAASINDIRYAFQLQKLLERDARGGTRYTELCRSHFGVDNPDSRLQRPEFLGSYSVPIQINTVPQTSGTEENGNVKTPQGNLAAFGLGVGMHKAFMKSFTEHGFVIGMYSIRGENVYQQGCPKMFLRRGRYDFYWPEFAHLGEEAILNKELYYQGTSQDDEAFGYQERWSEYKYGRNLITGQLRSTYAQSLDFWHLGQKFDNLPTLSSEFIVENQPLERVLAVTDVPQFKVDIFSDIKSIRPMPLYSDPGLADHF